MLVCFDINFAELWLQAEGPVGKVAVLAVPQLATRSSCGGI